MSDVQKWLIRKRHGKWWIWKPFHGCPDYRADTWVALLVGRWERLDWI